jgi:glycosyltransferase involved in cell wall biosynthesis
VDARELEDARIAERPHRTEPEFSVIIPTHNRTELLLEAVASVRAQTIDDVEIVVVDDGSDPPVVLEDDIVVVRLDPPRGPAAARNAGVVASSGRSLAFLDDDDLWLPDRLLFARLGLQRAAVAVCFSRFVGESERASRGRMLDGDVSRTIREGMTPNLGQTAVLRSAWLPLAETHLASADVDWWIRMAQQHRVATEPEVGFLYRLHPGPRTATAPAARIKCGLQILEDHADYFAANPRAAGFHWFRMGLTARRCGDRRLARQALWRSLRLRPNGRTAYHLVRTLLVVGT